MAGGVRRRDLHRVDGAARPRGHTVADGKIYTKGMLDFKRDIAADAAILFAQRHAERAAQMASTQRSAGRRRELERIAEVCQWVPVHAPRDFWEALQMYWFCRPTGS
jgi:formate C-acetyltransferase